MNLRKTLVSLVVLSALSAGVPSAFANDDLNHALDKTGQALDDGADKTGDALEKTLDKTGDALSTNNRNDRSGRLADRLRERADARQERRQEFRDRLTDRMDRVDRNTDRRGLLGGR
jgi:hypothetical protein